MTPPAPTFASASVFGRPLRSALETVCSQVLERLGGVPDFAVLFVSTQYVPDCAGAPREVRTRLGGPPLIGCTGAGVCGTEGESEETPGVALLAGRGLGASLRPFRLDREQLTLGDPAGAVREEVGLDTAAAGSFLLLADPFSADPEALLRALEQTYPGVPATGGLASGASRPGGHGLFLNDDVHTDGVIGWAFCERRLRTVVSQGCRPVGRRVVVTKMKDGRVLGLSGEPALDVVEREVAALPERDRVLSARNLLVGRVAFEAREDFGRGDFLVRNLVGVIPPERSIVVGDRLRLGQTLQLQLRDRAAAEEDMDVLYAAAAHLAPASAALLFTCAGRGRALFGRSGADVEGVHRAFGDLPLAGFACGGEIGPVGGRNFVHGFTASLALL